MQQSVFECNLTAALLKRLTEQASAIIKTEDHDSLRIYQLCGQCLSKVEIIGGAPALAPETFVII